MNNVNIQHHRGLSELATIRPTADAPVSSEANGVAAFASFDRKAATMTTRTILTRAAGLGEVLPNLTTPTIILMGAEDGLYPPDSALPIARLTPNARIKVVSGCAHHAPIDAPEAVDAAIDRLGHT